MFRWKVWNKFLLSIELNADFLKKNRKTGEFFSRFLSFFAILNFFQKSLDIFSIASYNTQAVSEMLL